MLTAAIWNASVRDDLLTTFPALASTSGGYFAVSAANAVAQRVPTAAAQTGAETTTSTTYTATLSGGAGTAGPSIASVTTSGKVLIAFHCRQSTNASGVNVWTSVAVSGASTIAATDNWAISADQLNIQIYHGICYIEPNIVSGSNTYTMQYHIASAGTATFSARRLNILPF